MNSPNFQSTNQRGTTLVELLVSLLIVGVFSAMMVSGLLQTSKQGYDYEIASRASERARSTLDFIVYDLRMTGAGIPFMQSGFQIGTVALGDAPLPILTSSDADTFSIRFNERGLNTVLPEDYTPSSSNLSFDVMDSSDYNVGDTIYLSDHTRAGASGMRAEIAALSGDTITIDSDYVVTSGATFPAGSVIHRVLDVVYDSPSDGSGITRTANGVTSVVEQNSSFVVRYLDQNGADISLPMTEAVIRDSLVSVNITVTVRGQKELRNGATYSVTASQEVALRNLVLSRTGT